MMDIVPSKTYNEIILQILRVTEGPLTPDHVFNLENVDILDVMTVSRVEAELTSTKLADNAKNMKAAPLTQATTDQMCGIFHEAICLTLFV